MRLRTVKHADSDGSPRHQLSLRAAGDVWTAPADVASARFTRSPACGRRANVVATRHSSLDARRFRKLCRAGRFPVAGTNARCHKHTYDRALWLEWPAVSDCA